jgi:hypothetical protein
VHFALRTITAPGIHRVHELVALRPLRRCGHGPNLKIAVIGENAVGGARRRLHRWAPEHIAVEAHIGPAMSRLIRVFESRRANVIVGRKNVVFVAKARQATKAGCRRTTKILWSERVLPSANSRKRCR